MKKEYVPGRVGKIPGFSNVKNKEVITFDDKVKRFCKAMASFGLSIEEAGRFCKTMTPDYKPKPEFLSIDRVKEDFITLVCLVDNKPISLADRPDRLLLAFNPLPYKYYIGCDPGFMDDHHCIQVIKVTNIGELNQVVESIDITTFKGLDFGTEVKRIASYWNAEILG